MKTSKIFGQSLYKWFFQELKDLKAFPNYFSNNFSFREGLGQTKYFFLGKIVFIPKPLFFCRERMGLTEAEAVGKMWSGVKAMIQVGDDTDDTNDTGSEHRYSKKQKQ